MPETDLQRVRIGHILNVEVYKFLIASREEFCTLIWVVIDK